MFFGLSLSGQRPIEIITNLAMPFPTEAGDLYEQYQNYSITVINHTDQPQSLFFLVDFFGDNGVAVTMDRFYQPDEAFTIGPNQIQVLTAGDLEELNTSLTESSIFYEGVTQAQLLLGSIPEGNYTLCVNAFDFETGTILSIGCSMPIYVGNANVPTIITPFEQEVIPDTELPVFNISWEFPSSDPAQAMNTNYEVKMVDISANYDWDIEELFGDNGIPVQLEEIVEIQTYYMYNNFGDDPPLIYGHEYGIRVRAFNADEGLSIQNAGYTEIRRFWYGEAGGVYSDTTGVVEEVAEQDTIPSDCEGRCNPQLATNITPITDLSTVSSIKIGNFYLENYNFTANGDRFNGDAEITLQFLSNIRIKVTAQNIKINSAGEVFSGKVKSQLAQEETIQGLADYLRIPDIANPALDMIPEQHVASLANILEFTRTLDALLGNDAVGLPLGFPAALKGNEMYLGLTDIELTPAGAKAKVMLSAKLAMFEGENSLILVGDSVCIHPQGFGGEYIFGLKSDLALTNANENAFELFMTGNNTNANNYCKVQMGCDGLESLSLYGHLLFPRSVLTPVIAGVAIVPPDQKVMARFGFTIDRGTGEDTLTQSNNINWLASVSVDKFEITGLKGWEFEVMDAYLDMSDLSNPPDINFPEDYHTTTPDFRGFYLKEARLKPPGHLITDSTSVLVRDLIIDPNIYGILQAENVLPIEKGTLAGFGFGIDSLHLHFYDNSLLSGRMKGPLQIPITDITDSLYYYALIENTALPGDTAAYMYVFDVSFQENVSFPFIIGEGEIYDDSYIDIGFMPSADDEVFVQVFLHGVLNIDTETFYPSSLPDLPAHAKMFGIEYAFDYTSGVGFDSDNTYISFASPQKGLGGFPINLDNFDVGLNASFETIAVQFNVDISFAKGELDLGAGVQFSLVSNLKTLDAFGNIISDGGQGALKTIKSLRLQQVQFDSIYIEVDKGSFGFYGMICFYNNPLPTGGRDKGVKGVVRVTLPVATVDLTVIFGNIGTPPDIPEGQPVVYSEDFYTYWYVSGKLTLVSGIPISSGVGIYGLGGGVGYNMIQTASSQIVDGEMVGDPVFSPVYNSFRLEFTVILGTLPSPDAFNADITLIAQFVNGGLDMIGIEGDGYIMTPIMERADPKVYVGVGIYLYTQNEERDWYMDGYLRVSVNVNDKFKGNIQNAVVPNQMVDASFYVSANSWYFYAGEPDMNPYDEIDPRGSAEFRINENLVAQFKAYMMVGHGIPLELPPLPADIQRILNDPSGELNETESVANVSSGVDGNASATGAGFAHGSYGTLSADIDARLVYASLQVYVGYDMNLTKRPYSCANTGGQIGINGWYAEGQAYAGIEGNLGIRLKLFGAENKFHLMSLAAAIALYGGAPAPAYFGGRASVRYALLGGKLKGHSSFQFSVGERCSIISDDPFAGITFIESVDPSDNENDIPPYARVLCKFVLPMDETIYIPSAVEDANGEIIDVIELGYTPKVTYEIKRANNPNGPSISLQNKIWVNNELHDALVLRPTNLFEENKNYICKITVKAIDEQSGTWLRTNDKIWFQDTIIHFRTGPYPEDLYDMVKYSVPMPYERYFLQQENSTERIYFTGGLPQAHYFPTTNPSGFGTITYFIRLTNLHDQSEIQIPFTNYSTSPFDPKLEFNLPELQNEKIYAMQVIRKNTGQITLTKGNTGRINLIDDQNDSLTLETTTLPPGELLRASETLLYHTYFRTSKYNNMAQKINAATVQSTATTGNSQEYGQKLRINFNMGEKFEERDFRSFTPVSEYASDMIFEPRVKSMDIFSKPYHDMAEDRIYNFKNYYQNTVFGHYPFNYAFPTNLKINWQNYSGYRISASNMAGPLDPPLTEAEVSGLWSNYSANGTFNYSAPSTALNFTNSSGVVGSGSVYILPNYNLTFDTHFKVSQDKKTIVDWANNYLTTYNFMLNSYYQTIFQSAYPDFIPKKNRVQNKSFKLENNPGNYMVHFNRNNSHIPSGESWSWFVGNIAFTTPNFGMVQTISGSSSGAFGMSAGPSMFIGN